VLAEYTEEKIHHVIYRWPRWDFRFGKIEALPVPSPASRWSLSTLTREGLGWGSFGKASIKEVP